MNALPIWDDEPHLTGAPVLDAAPDPTALTRTDTTPSLFDGLPADPRRSALVAVLEALGPDTSLEEAALALLAAIDVADTVAGIARVDTNDAVLQQRIARIISGANLPSRGPGTRAREVLALLLTVKTV
jgi:hypothetical protein